MGAGEAVAVVGPSGSGKSTLLSIAGLLTPIVAGELTIAGTRVHGASQSDLRRLRRENVGILFQESNLIRHLTVLENVITPVLSKQFSASTAYAADLLDFVGLKEYAARVPGTLSGGQAQRVALCRALINRPRLIIADEPTASLDAESGELIRNLLSTLRSDGLSFLVATHDANTAQWADREYGINNGTLNENRSGKAVS